MHFEAPAGLKVLQGRHAMGRRLGNEIAPDLAQYIDGRCGARRMRDTQHRDRRLIDERDAARAGHGHRFTHQFDADCRQPRIFDATLIDSLRQGTAFFASACMIAIGGGIAVIGNAATVQRLTDDLPLAGTGPDVALRMLPEIGFLANALLKFVWAHRLFGYCSILMAAVPNDPADPSAFHRAGQAAEINITAAKSFNRGLQSIYFALAALGWLVGPWGLLAGVTLATAILLRREFASVSRRVILMRQPPVAKP